MNISYIDCPKCDNEIGFKIERECDGAARASEIIRFCDCHIPDYVSEELETAAVQKSLEI